MTHKLNFEHFYEHFGVLLAAVSILFNFHNLSFYYLHTTYKHGILS